MTLIGLMRSSLKGSHGFPTLEEDMAVVVSAFSCSKLLSNQREPLLQPGVNVAIT